MPHQGVFTRVLARKLSNQSENIISDSLAHLLNTSDTTRKAFIKFLTVRLGIEMSDLVFSTQVHQRNASIPDVLGRDAQQHTKVIIEAKFWASLTDRQPVDYLSLLDDDGLLLFVVPELRKELVWAELQHRCAVAGIQYDQSQSLNSIAYLRTSSGRWLAVTTWVTLIDAIIQDLDNKDDKEAIADLIQIKGFCEYVDTTAFHPVAPSELDSLIAKRTLQYVDLVDAIINKLYSSGTIRGWKSNKSRKVKSSGRYFNYKDTNYFGIVQFNLNYWAEMAASPLWIMIVDSKWSFPTELVDAFRTFVQDKQSKMVELPEGILLPLWIKPYVEQEDVIADLLIQIEEIHQLLPRT